MYQAFSVLEMLTWPAHCVYPIFSLGATLLDEVLQVRPPLGRMLLGLTAKELMERKQGGCD